MWTEFLWLTTDKEPGHGDKGCSVRLKINLPRNDGKLKRATKITVASGLPFLGDWLTNTNLSAFH
jgi:hypothetical protein